jgi:hypothetical protein
MAQSNIGRLAGPSWGEVDPSTGFVMGDSGTSSLQDLLFALLLHLVENDCQDDRVLVAIDKILKSELMLVPRLPFQGDVDRILARVDELTITTVTEKQIIQDLRQKIKELERLERCSHTDLIGTTTGITYGDGTDTEDIIF